MASFTSSIVAAIYEVLFVFYSYPNAMTRKRRPLTALQLVVGAPERLLFDRGSNFLSELVGEVCRLMQIKKINTSGYHPQMDGLVERFHRTLISMLSRYVEKHARDWDHYLPYMLYAYRVTAQESTRESPFFLLFGRDARQPLEEALDCPTSAYMVDLDDYKSELVQGLTSAWDTAAECIKSAQSHQKSVYDRTAKTVNYRVGDRVMVHMPLGRLLSLPDPTLAHTVC